METPNDAITAALLLCGVLCCGRGSLISFYCFPLHSLTYGTLIASRIEQQSIDVKKVKIGVNRVNRDHDDIIGMH